MLVNKKVVINCDNMVSVRVLNTGASRNSFLQSCLREICYIAAKRSGNTCHSSTLHILANMHLLIIFHLDLKIPRTTLWKPRYTMAKMYSTTTNLASDLEEVVALKLWGHMLVNKKVVINCDNMVSVRVLNTGASRNSFLQSLN
jgi:hypothetical protein